MSYRSSSSSSSSLDELAASALGVGLLLSLALLLLALYALARAANLVWRVSRRHGASRALRVALGTTAILWAVAAVLGALALSAAPTLALASAPVLDAGAGGAVAAAVLSTLALVITARCVELYHDNLFQRVRTNRLSRK